MFKSKISKFEIKVSLIISCCSNVMCLQKHEIENIRVFTNFLNRYSWRRVIYWTTNSLSIYHNGCHQQPTTRIQRAIFSCLSSFSSSSFQCNNGNRRVAAEQSTDTHTLIDRRTDRQERDSTSYVRKSPTKCNNIKRKQKHKHQARTYNAVKREVCIWKSSHGKRNIAMKTKSTNLRLENKSNYFASVSRVVLVLLVSGYLYN